MCYIVTPTGNVLPSIISDTDLNDTAEKRRNHKNLENGQVSAFTPGRKKPRVSHQKGPEFRDSISESDHTLVSAWEDFSPDYALTLLEKFQEMDEFEDWDLKIDEPTMRLWVAKNGSFLNFNLPFLHSELIFDAKYPFELVVDAINDPAHKEKWDDNIKSIEVVNDDNLDEVLYHTTYKDIPFVATVRDFIEKKLNFTTKNMEGEDVFVSLSSSIPDEYLPPAKGVTRWETLFHLMIYEPQNDGSTIVQSFSQWDPKLPIVAKSIVNRVIMRNSVKWYDSWAEYLESLL